MRSNIYGVALAGIVLVAALSAAAEAAQFDPAQVAAVGKAADAFAQLGKNAFMTGEPPRQTNPKVAKLLDVIFDTGKLNDGPDPIPLAQRDKLDEWLLRVVQTGFIYISAGTGISDINKIDSLSDGQVNENVVAFAPEVGRLYDAQLALTRAESDAVAAELAAHPDKFDPAATRLALTRESLAETLVSVIATFSVAGLDSAWIRAREAALMAMVPTAVKLLETEPRKQVAAAALQMAGTMKDAAAKDGLTAFAKAISP